MKNTEFSSAILVIASLLQLITATNVNSCSENDSLPDEITIDGCAQQPCILKIGQNAVFTMSFRAPRYLENIKPKAIATVAGLSIDYPFLNQDDACEGITNTPCPLAAREKTEYRFEMYISDIFPETSLSLAFSLVDKDKNNENFVCFKFDALVRKP